MRVGEKRGQKEKRGREMGKNLRNGRDEMDEGHSHYNIWDTSLMCYWSKRPQKSPNQHKLLTLQLVTNHNYMVRYCCWRHYTLLQKNVKNYFSCFRKVLYNMLWQKLCQWSYPVPDPVCYSTDLTGKMCLLEQWGHNALGIT